MMGRKRKLSKCQSEAAENEKRWCKNCQNKRGVNQCEGPVPETRLAEDEGHDDKLRASSAQPAAIGAQYSTPQPRFTCTTCGKDSYLDVCVRCLQSPTTEPTRTPEPSISPTTTSGRPIKSPVPHAFPPNQVSRRFSMLHVVHAMSISCRFGIVDPPRTLQSDGLRKTRQAGG